MKIEQWAEDLWSAGDLDLADALYAPRYRYQGFERTPDQFKKGIAAWRAAFPDLTVTLGIVVAESEWVSWEWVVRGTFRMPFQGRQPTGRPVVLAGIHIARFLEGVIVEEREYFDTAALAQQLESSG